MSEDERAVVLRLQRADGSSSAYLVSARVLPVRSSAQLVALHLSVVQAADAADAHREGVAGLPDRQAMTRRLQRSILRSRVGPPDYVFALLLADLDSFKLVNASLGRATADELLRAIAERLSDSIRPGDQVAHLGSDEFAILLDHLATPSDALQVARRIQQTLARAFQIDGQDVFASVSIGIALSSTGYQTGEEVLRDASTAATRAKAAGPGRIEIFDPAMRTRALARLRLESDLRRALEREELRVHYQPVVSMKDGGVVGFEALVRWQHEERGLVSPAEFLPIAEQTRLIAPIGSWVLSQVCQRGRSWQRLPGSGGLTLSANVAAAQFSEASLFESVVSALEQSGLSGASLILEITESVLLSDFEAVVEVLRELRLRGVRVHLDDFGTGYSSLGYLSRLPADAVKIDRSFVARMLEDRQVDVLVRAIIELAHNLDKIVIAEGIEKKEQMARLQELGCDMAQGYHFSRPMDEASAEAWLRASPKGFSHA